MTAPDKAFEEWKAANWDRLKMWSWSVGKHEEAQQIWLASRKEALSEAAKVCQSHEPKDFTTAGIITRAKCAQVILALIVDNPQAKVANRPDEG